MGNSPYIVTAVELEKSFTGVRQRMEKACKRAGRDPATVTLVSVSKGHPPETVRAAADLGQTVFGESRIQEARVKIDQSPSRLHWHFIGHLQSNKCREAVALFEMLQSVDSVALAREISKWADREGKTMPVLLEVNVAGESSKFGFPPEQLLSAVNEINPLPKIEIQGLMTIAPWAPDPEKVRPIFRQLRELKEHCEKSLGAPLPHLSMGMSGDFEVAIDEGATLVRIGTALFGPRAKAKKELRE